MSTIKTPPNKRFRTSTPEPENRQPAKEPEHCPLKEIINHKPAFTVPQTDIIVAPGQRGARANTQRGAQRVNAVMAAGQGYKQSARGRPSPSADIANDAQQGCKQRQLAKAVVDVPH